MVKIYNDLILFNIFKFFLDEIGLDEKTKIIYVIDRVNNTGDTPLMVAADVGVWSIAAKLLKAGADPNKKALDGQTPLSIAILFHHYMFVKLFLNFKQPIYAINVDHMDKYGRFIM